jgi:Tfp pilus assembly protein PilN
MTSDNPVADKLVTDARKKTERLQSPTLALAALIVGILGVIAAPFMPIAGWILGAVTIGLGVPGMQREVSAKQAKIAVVIGVAAILVGVFFFTYTISKG